MAKPCIYKLALLSKPWVCWVNYDCRFFPTWAEAIAYALSLSEKVSQP